MRKHVVLFTLLGLLFVFVLYAAVVILFTPVYWKITEIHGDSLCKNNLKQIFSGLFLYKQRFGKWPQEGGPKFILSLWKEEIIDKTRKNSALFLCPGVPRDLEDNDEGRAYARWDKIDSSMCGYACRNIKKHPLPMDVSSFNKNRYRNSPLDALLVSDDCDEPLNHEFKINLLFADGSIDDVDVIVFGGADFLVGEDAPAPEKDEKGRFLWPDFRVLKNDCD